MLALLVPIYVLAFNIPSKSEIYIASVSPTPTEMRSPTRDEIAREIHLATITAYSAIDSCHYANCITASGKPAYVGGVACPRKYRLGTKVRIGDEVYVCEDRTAKKYDGRFDIFMGYTASAHKKAIIFGLRKLEVEILK